MRRLYFLKLLTRVGLAEIDETSPKGLPVLLFRAILRDFFTDIVGIEQPES